MITNANGWVKLHRKLEEWEWYTDSKSVHLFIHLLIKANHKPKKWRGVDINPGQFITALGKLSAETGISLQSVRTILDRMKSTCELTCESTSKHTKITICNWATYQSDIDLINTPINTPSNIQSTFNQQTTNKQVTTNNNEENVKNEENERESREGLPQCFIDFITSKNHIFSKDQNRWRAAWGEMTAHRNNCTEVIEWALDNYKYSISKAMFFTGDSWPKIQTAYVDRNNKGKPQSVPQVYRSGDVDWEAEAANANQTDNF